MGQNIRTVTGASTVPAYDTYSGTVTTNATTTTKLICSSVDLQEIFGEHLVVRNQWFYDGTEVRKIKAVWETTEASVIEIESAFTTPLAAATPLIVDANLRAYSIANNGGASGEVNGKTIINTQVVNEETDSDQISSRRYLDAVAVDATGTSFLIIENR